ncbi:hypothetical protein [Streptomyces griseus]|uniref:hypothetical protein n=1 Tax=Streptomyces griseus TaxID=1911 RepID=UPI0033F3CFE8
MRTSICRTAAVIMGLFVPVGCAAGETPDAKPKPKLRNVTGKTYREALKLVDKTEGLVGTHSTQAEGVDFYSHPLEVRRNQDEWIVCEQEVTRGENGEYDASLVLSPTVAECTADAPDPVPVGTPIKALTPPRNADKWLVSVWAGLRVGMHEDSVSAALGVELLEACQIDDETPYGTDHYGVNCWINDIEYGTLIFREGPSTGLYPNTVGLQHWQCCTTGRPEGN